MYLNHESNDYFDVHQRENGTMITELVNARRIVKIWFHFYPGVTWVDQLVNVVNKYNQVIEQCETVSFFIHS